MINEQLLPHRKAIDKIDDQLLALLNQRATHCLAIGKLKHQQDPTLSNIQDHKREADIFKRLTDQNPGPLSNNQIKALFELIIAQNRELEYNCSNT